MDKFDVGAGATYDIGSEQYNSANVLGEEIMRSIVDKKLSLAVVSLMFDEIKTHLMINHSFVPIDYNSSDPYYVSIGK